MAKLVVRKGRNPGSEYKLNADRLIMGRRSACPIPILDPKSSREHAVVTRQGERFFLQDLSRNGTFLNEALASKDPAAPSPLSFGDQIRIGDTVLEVVDEKNEIIPIDISGYKILEKIGAGGMGTVYKAKQLSMDRIVALKVLNERYSADREFVDRFIREARAAGKLNHPNVIHVHDVSKANGRHYFSMEFIDGNSVKEMLRIHRKMEPKRAMDIVIQTAKALEFAHENRIVHRDIKPDNIMLSKDGVVKIADLGIAKTFEDSGGAVSNTRRVMGTPHYMAPEQALGKEIDHRVDIYSLGATFYHMLTGTTPFAGSTAHEVLRAHIQESLPAIQEFESGVPDPICFIVERMMAKLPEKRYPNMTRLIEDLERAQQGISEGIERIAVGESTITRALSGKVAGALEQVRSSTENVGTGLQAGLPRSLVLAGLVALFLLAVLISVALFRSPNTPPESTPPAPPTVPVTPAPPSPPSPGPGPVALPSEAEARQRLEDARKQLEADPISPAAEKLLQEILANFPASTSRDEAQNLLNRIRDKRKELEVAKVSALLAQARDFESKNSADASKMEEIARQYRSVQEAGAAAPEPAEQARAKAEEWEKRRQEALTQEAAAAFRSAGDAADSGLRQKDFDAARKPWKEFLAKYPGAADKFRAEARAAEVEAEAVKEWQAVKRDADRAEKDPVRPLPSGLKAWEEYLSRVHDAAHRGEAEEALKALQARAEKYRQDESGKIADLAKQFEYEAALARNKDLVQRLAGTAWSEALKARDAQIVAQAALHEKVVKAINDQAQKGPQPLPFKAKMVEKLEVADWASTGASPARLALCALPVSSGLGVQKKFADLTPAQQYAIYRQFLTELSAEDHRALAAFCTERGLTDEAAAHSGQSGTP